MFKTAIVIISLLWASLLLVSWSASSETATLSATLPADIDAGR